MKRDHLALVAYLESRAAMPFAWGDQANDCISHFLGAAQATTGKRPSLGKLKWADERSALRTLKRLGGLEAAMDGLFAETPPSMAQRGDAALVRLPAGLHPDVLEGSEFIMVVEGETLVGPGLQGHVRLPRRAMSKAWSAT